MSVSARPVWPTPPGQTLAESNGLLVHIDHSLPHPYSVDHTPSFPILSIPTLPQKEESARKESGKTIFDNIIRLFERILTIPRVPLDLLLSPFSFTVPLQTDALLAIHATLPVIAISQPGMVRLYDLRTGSFLKYHLTLPPSFSLTALTFSKFNILAGGTSNGTVFLWTLNLSIMASTPTSNVKVTAVQLSPIFLIPDTFPAEAILGRITGLSFSSVDPRYLAISTLRGGVWLHDTLLSESSRILPGQSYSVSWSTIHSILAVGSHGKISLLAALPSGGLTFSEPRIINLSHTAEVKRMEWDDDGRVLFYSSNNGSGISALYVTPSANLRAPNVEKYGSIPTPPLHTLTGDVRYGGQVKDFKFHTSLKRLVVNFENSVLLELFEINYATDGMNGRSLGLIRAPPTSGEGYDGGKTNAVERELAMFSAECNGMGFISGVVEGSIFVGQWTDKMNAEERRIGFVRLAI